MKAVQQLQLEVLLKFGITPLQPSDCKDLSAVVRELTGKIVSETTIKRFFGFAAQTFNFSVYTLNALSEYAGYNNWEFFLEHYRQQQSPQMAFHPKWQEFKSRTGKITFYTTEAIKNNCGMDFCKTALRLEPSNLQHFLDTELVASVVLAPSGYGKSIALAQMVESFWLSESCQFPGDVCLFVNVHHLNTLINRGFSMEDWLDNQLNLGDGENLIEYFEQHPTERDGKFVLIVDGFDDKVLGNDKLKIIYSKLMDLVSSRAHTKWMKVILAARPDAWNVLFTPLAASGSLPWLTGPASALEHEPTLIFNLPMLTREEVRMVLKNHSLPETTINTLGDPFLSLMEFPPFLQLACPGITAKGPTLIHEDYLTYQIIGQYCRCKVVSSPDYSLKAAIIRKILDENHKPNAKSPAGQVRLFSGDIRVQESYRKLLSDSILIEENQDGHRSLPVKRVRFFNEYIALFFIATFYVCSSNGQMGEELIATVLAGSESEDRKAGILRWFLLYAIDQRDGAAVESLFAHIASYREKALLLEFLLVNLSGQEDLMQIARNILMEPVFKQYFLRTFLLYDVQGIRRNYLRETLQELLESEEDQLNVACLYFLSGLYQLDNSLTSSQLPLFQKGLMKFNRKETALHPGELCLFIDQILNEKKADDITRDKVYQFEEYLLLSDHNVLSLRDELTVHLLLYCVVLLKEYKYMERIIEYVFREVPSLKMRSHDPFRIIALSAKCRYYLYDNEYEGYNKCIAHIESVLSSGSSISGYQIVSIYFEQVKAIRHFIDGEYDKVLESVQRAQIIAKSIRFTLFEHWCYKVQASAFLALRKQKLSELAEKEAERIREQCLFARFPAFDFNGFVSEFSGKSVMNH
jgi:hypothetical protein